MKFLRFSVFAIAILGMVGLFSCGSDDAPDPTTEQKFAGTWVITSTNGNAVKASPTTTISGATATLVLEATSANVLTYTLNTTSVPTFNGAAGTPESGTFSLNTTGTSASVNSSTNVTIGTSITNVAAGNDLVLTYSIPSAVSTDADFKTFDTITLTLAKQ